MNIYIKIFFLEWVTKNLSVGWELVLKKERSSHFYIPCFTHYIFHLICALYMTFTNGGGCFLLFFIISVSLLGRLLCRDGCVLKNLEDASSRHFCSSTRALCSWLEGGSRTKSKMTGFKNETSPKMSPQNQITPICINKWELQEAEEPVGWN